MNINAITRSKGSLVAAVFVILVLSLSIFKNISYPLLWNDEAETAMHGLSVTEYGYPKVHIGENVVYPILHPNMELAIHEETDAYIGSYWAMYYYAVIGVLASNLTDDLYLKTALLRVPFALLGLAGLILLALSVLPVLGSEKKKHLFIILFGGFLFLSVSTMLHLREVRYLSIVVFLGAALIYIYSRYSFLGTINFRSYLIGMTTVLWLSFNTFPPSFFCFIVIIGISEIWNLYGRIQENQATSGLMDSGITMLLKRAIVQLPLFAKKCVPILLAFILLIPVINFFNSFHIAQETASLYSYTYLQQLYNILVYLGKFEFFHLFIVLKLALLFLYLVTKDKLDQNTRELMKVSSFILLFFSGYLLVTAMIPSSLYTRYFIMLLPVLCLAIAIDVLLLFQVAEHLKDHIKTSIKGVLMVVLFIVFLINGLGKVSEVKGHMAETFTQYKGPLDYLIPFIYNKYTNPENLVIATNYEECSYMFYLGSHVTLGYVGNNLAEDTLIQPDIIVYRKEWPHNPAIMKKFLKMGNYQKELFPVYDYRVNNIPELHFFVNKHLYKTKLTTDESLKTDIFYLD